MISIDKITRRFGDFRALDEISLALPDTGLVALTGENGCGKTTLLNLLSSMDRADAGEIRFNDIQYCRKNMRIIRSDIVSFVQQENVFIDYIRILQNIGFGSDSETEIERYLCELDIAEKKNSYPFALSGGQRQKASFIRGICSDTPVLLVDEPTSSMDEYSESVTFEILKKLSARRLVIVVSHNRELIRKYADLTILLNKGKVEQLIVRESGSLPEAEVKGDEVWIPSNGEYDVQRDWQLIRAILEKNGSVLLKLKTKGSSTHSESRDTIPGTEALHNHSRKSKGVSAIAFRSMKVQLGRSLCGCFLCLLWLLILSVMLSLNAMDIYELASDVFCENGYQQVFYTTESGKENATELSLDFLEALTKEKAAKPILFYNLDGNVLEIGLPESTNYAYSAVNRFALFSPDNNSFSLCTGRMPGAGECLMTDYIADQFIASGKYVSFEEILSTGIQLAGYPLGVSGIIETDYRTFHSLYQRLPPDSVSKQEAELAKYKAEYLYCALYLPVESYLTYPETGVNCTPLSYGSCFVDIRILPESFSGSSGIYSDFEMKDASGYLKSPFFVGKYQGIVADYLSEKPTVYLTRDIYETGRTEYCKTVPFVGMIADVSSTDVLKGLETKKADHQTPVSETVNRAVNLIVTVQRGFVPILFLVFSLLLVCSVLIWTFLMSRHTFAVYRMVSRGYSCGAVILFSLIRTVCKLLPELIAAFALYFPMRTVINQTVSKLSGIVMRPVQATFGVCSAAFAVYAGAVLLYAVLYSVVQYNRNPIKLYWSCAKGK